MGREVSEIFEEPDEAATPLGDVWRWPGKFRTTPRNIGIDYWLIPLELRHLLDDGKAGVEFGTYPADEIAVRFHHRLCGHTRSRTATAATPA